MIQVYANSGNRYTDLEQAQNAASLASVPLVVKIIRQRIKEGRYQVIDGHVVMTDNNGEKTKGD